jgi:ABC-type antimicrobial peptide transport system permease subunit
MEQWVQRTLQLPALLTAMAALFAGASLLLACLGLYGVVSYTAELRLREFGIRMALGARAGQVSALVLQHAGILALCGCAIGLALAWPVATWLQSLLFGVSRGDLLSWIMAPAALIAVAVASALAPARRAGRTDPAVMLRLE